VKFAYATPNEILGPPKYSWVSKASGTIEGDELYGYGGEEYSPFIWPANSDERSAHDEFGLSMKGVSRPPFLCSSNLHARPSRRKEARRKEFPDHS
jgi:hypothetical protein